MRRFTHRGLRGLTGGMPLSLGCAGAPVSPGWYVRDTAASCSLWHLMIRRAGLIAVICAALVGGCAGTSPTEQAPRLRVGTTGDLPPFSVATPGGFVGIDIDLARDFGRALNREVTFVGMAWPTMLGDARAGRFDLAFSGVSITPPRQLEVDFSIPYTEYSRVAVVRCAESDRFLTFEDLDTAGVTVTAVRGGAAATYAQANLRHATIRLAEELTDELPSVVAGTVDVAIMPPHTVRRYRGLCVGLQGRRFFSTPIAVMLPKGSSLTPEVNDWLRRRLEDGTVAALLDHYGARQ